MISAEVARETPRRGQTHPNQINELNPSNSTDSMERLIPLQQQRDLLPEKKPYRKWPLIIRPSKPAHQHICDKLSLFADSLLFLFAERRSNKPPVLCLITSASGGEEASRRSTRRQRSEGAEDKDRTELIHRVLSSFSSLFRFYGPFVSSSYFHLRKCWENSLYADCEATNSS